MICEPEFTHSQNLLPKGNKWHVHPQTTTHSLCLAQLKADILNLQPFIYSGM